MQMAQDAPATFPARFADLKRELAKGKEEALTMAWHDVLAELEMRTAEFASSGPSVVPQVQFAELDKLPQETIDDIRRKGCIIIRGVVDEPTAREWKTWLHEFIDANPTLDGLPVDNKQFFNLYWSRSQVRARAHPNVLAATAFINGLFHSTAGEPPSAAGTTPLSYADRFRIRTPGGEPWLYHPPHNDGASIERWEDPGCRSIYGAILDGDWRAHDAYDLSKRVAANTDLYGRSGQASVFRAFQGWLAMSETGPGEGTLRVFPDVLLSNAYIILRPFFRHTGGDIYDPANWVFDTAGPEFPGIEPKVLGFHGPRISPEEHPHLRTDSAMVSIPAVRPGDMALWHCDLVHAVEVEHNGRGDSAVMYIPAVPATKRNVEYILEQRDAFLAGLTPPDFGGQGLLEKDYVGIGTEQDVNGLAGRVAMGLEPIAV